MAIVKYSVEIDHFPKNCKSCNFFDAHRCVVGDYAISDDEAESFPEWCPLERVEWHPEHKCIPIEFIEKRPEYAGLIKEWNESRECAG